MGFWQWADAHPYVIFFGFCVAVWGVVAIVEAIANRNKLF